MTASNIDKELIRLLFTVTRDKIFTEDVFDRLKTDDEKNRLITYLKNSGNPTISEINRKSLDIVTPRWKSKTY